MRAGEANNTTRTNNQNNNDNTVKTANGDTTYTTESACHSHYALPPRMTFIGEFNGGPVLKTPANADPVQHHKDIYNLEMRDDDVVVVAYPKCGTHWIFEITQMLLKQTATYESRTKEFFMMEFTKPDDLGKLESPRVLNSHLRLSQLPAQCFHRKTKIIHVTRNPKDVLVSLFFHLSQHAPKGFSLGNLLSALIAGKHVSFGDQFSYLSHVETFTKDNPGYPIKSFYYEDMKQDPVSVVKDLATFLNVTATDELCQEISDACHFDKLKMADTNRKLPDHIGNALPGLSLYRKGQIGDWKNHLTVHDNEVMDAFIEREMAKGLNFKFKYE